MWCESHLAFSYPDVTLLLCGSWPVHLGSPGSGRWPFQGPCGAACALGLHGRCHMSTFYYLGSWREASCFRSQRSCSILQTHWLPQDLPYTLCFSTRPVGWRMRCAGGLSKGPCVCTGRRGTSAPACHNTARSPKPNLTAYRPPCHPLSLLPPPENRPRCPQAL